MYKKSDWMTVYHNLKTENIYVLKNYMKIIFHTFLRITFNFAICKTFVSKSPGRRPSPLFNNIVGFPIIVINKYWKNTYSMFLKD